MTHVVKKRRGHVDTHRKEGHMTMESDWRDAAVSQGMSRIAGNHQELGKRQGTDSPLEPPEGTDPADALTPDF